MKKIIALFLIFSMLICLLSSCVEPEVRESDPDTESPTTESAEPSEQPNDPLEEPTESDSEPKESEIAPTESEIAPTESEIAPTESEIAPTESEIVPTESEIEPTESEIEPTESEGVPTESEAEPTESEIEPTESEIEPTDSEVKPTDSEIEPTESEINPTESEPESTDLESESTESSKSDASSSNPSDDDDYICADNYIYEFATIEDLHTWVTTGSTNLEDYSAPPSFPFDEIMSPEFIMEYFGYHSIYEYFTFDEAVFDKVGAYFGIDSDYGFLRYNYSFDDLVRVSIRPVRYGELRNLLICYRHETLKTITENDLVPYSKDCFDSDNEKLTVLRELGDFRIIYDVLSGVKTRVHFIVGGAYITIEVFCGNWCGPLEELYDVFVSNEKVSAFSAFFSDDDETFAAAVERAQKPAEDEAEEEVK